MSHTSLGCLPLWVGRCTQISQGLEEGTDFPSFLSQPAHRDQDLEKTQRRQVSALPSSFRGFRSPVPRWRQATAQIWKAGLGITILKEPQLLGFQPKSLGINAQPPSECSSCIWGGVCWAGLCAHILSLTEALLGLLCKTPSVRHSGEDLPRTLYFWTVTFL